jgi:hypothetical protein
VKEIDFLPEWYKEGKRRRTYMRRQYVALTVIFLTMLTYNLTAEHRIAKASAAVSRLEDQRIRAEHVMLEFNRISKELGEHQTEANALKRIDSRVNLGAVLAEISHVIGDRVILSRVEFVSEALSEEDKKAQSKGGSTVRTVGKSSSTAKQIPLGNVRFRIVLAGVAIDPADVGELVCRLDDSPYFRRVYPSYSRNGKVSVSMKEGKEPEGRETGQISTDARETLQISEFEITCYLANYEEIGA